MPRLLYIKSSPRGERSHSCAVAGAFMDVYKKAHPKDEIEVLDLFKDNVTALDALAVQAKYSILHGVESTSDEKKSWKAVEETIQHFISADKYLFAIPMWNFSIPYRLKQYIDVIVQPTYTFSFSPDTGYKGLVTGKPACAVYSRGGEYKAGTPAEAFDMQKKYFESILGFIGFTDVRSIVVEPMLAGGPKVAKVKQDEAIKEAKSLAAVF